MRLYSLCEEMSTECKVGSSCSPAGILRNTTVSFEVSVSISQRKTLSYLMGGGLCVYYAHFYFCLCFLGTSNATALPLPFLQFIRGIIIVSCCLCKVLWLPWDISSSGIKRRNFPKDTLFCPVLFENNFSGEKRKGEKPWSHVALFSVLSVDLIPLTPSYKSLRACFLLTEPRTLPESCSHSALPSLQSPGWLLLSGTILGLSALVPPSVMIQLVCLSV